MCWTILLLLFFLWQQHCWKQTDCWFDHLLCGKSNYHELLLVLLIWWGKHEHAALAEWAEGEVIEYNHSVCLCPVNLQTSTPKHWILLMKSSQQELCFSGISKPYQLGEALANNHMEQPDILLPGKAWERLILAFHWVGGSLFSASHCDDI